MDYDDEDERERNIMSFGIGVKPETLVSVRFYTCNCDWVTKHCSENHTAYARIPKSVLDQYRS